LFSYDSKILDYEFLIRKYFYPLIQIENTGLSKFPDEISFWTTGVIPYVESAGKARPKIPSYG
jgi:hypothetical protein